MAIAAACVWEIRLTNGLDTNGGGFVAGATGTDWSQQNSPQYSVTDGVTAGTTTITSATANFGTDVVGNILYITGGTGSITAGWYQIATWVNATTITVDRSTGLTTGTGATVHIGGAFLTVAQAASIWVAGNKGFVKGESGSAPTATTTLSVSTTPANNAPANQLIGYTTTRTDGGRATLTLSTNTGLIGLSVTGTGWWIQNIAVDCSSLGTSIGIKLTANYCVLHNCLLKNATSASLFTSGTLAGCIVRRCEITGCTSAATAAINHTATVVMCFLECNIHDNACTGISTITGASNAVIEDCLITNNTGASSDGIQCQYGLLIRRNTIHGNGRHGINNTTIYPIGSVWYDNSFSGNGGYGEVYASGAGNPAVPWMDGNAYGYPANTSGTFNNYNDTTTNKQNGVSPYVDVFDQTVTAGTQYVSAVSSGNGGNWALNSTASQGALLDYGGQPQTWPGNTAPTNGYPSIGAVQYKNTASGSGMLVHPGMTGGARG